MDDPLPDELVRAGWAAGDVISSDELGGGAASQPDQTDGWRDADYVVTSEAMRERNDIAEVGQAMDNSVIVATFGDGDELVEIRRIVPEGAVLAAAAARRQEEMRIQFGSELAQNPAVVMSEADRALLVAGRVDPRIAAVLGALAAQGEVVVAGFPVLQGEREMPIRQLALTSIGGVALAADAAPTPAASVLLDGLSGPFVPDDVSARADTLVLRFPVSLEPLAD